MPPADSGSTHARSSAELQGTADHMVESFCALLQEIDENVLAGKISTAARDKMTRAIRKHQTQAIKQRQTELRAQGYSRNPNHNRKVLQSGEIVWHSTPLRLRDPDMDDDDDARVLSCFGDVLDKARPHAVINVDGDNVSLLPLTTRTGRGADGVRDECLIRVLNKGCTDYYDTDHPKRAVFVDGEDGIGDGSLISTHLVHARVTDWFKPTQTRLTLSASMDLTDFALRSLAKLYKRHLSSRGIPPATLRTHRVQDLDSQKLGMLPRGEHGDLLEIAAIEFQTGQDAHEKALAQVQLDARNVARAECASQHGSLSNKIDNVKAFTRNDAAWLDRLDNEKDARQHSINDMSRQHVIHLNRTSQEVYFAGVSDGLDKTVNWDFSLHCRATGDSMNKGKELQSRNAQRARNPTHAPVHGQFDTFEVNHVAPPAFGALGFCAFAIPGAATRGDSGPSTPARSPTIAKKRSSARNESSNNRRSATSSTRKGTTDLVGPYNTTMENGATKGIMSNPVPPSFGRSNASQTGVSGSRNGDLGTTEQSTPSTSMSVKRAVPSVRSPHRASNREATHGATAGVEGNHTGARSRWDSRPKQQAEDDGNNFNDANKRRRLNSTASSLTATKNEEPRAKQQKSFVSSAFQTFMKPQDK